MAVPLESSCGQEVTHILGARASVLHEDPDARWDVSIAEGKIQFCGKHQSSSLSSDSLAQGDGVLDARGRFLAPSLCHPHVHLDKCFLLSDPKYQDLKIEKGTFEEAMALTAKAKAIFQEDDLLRRGRWLIQESIDAGVTHIRAFVEVDSIVRFKCLEAGLKLKKEFEGRCHIQICAFAQNPIFTGDDAAEGRMLVEQALQTPGVDVLGTTPYVEDENDGADLRNIEWAFDMAIRYRKHLDFHLDYHLNRSKQPRVFYVLRTAEDRSFYDLNGKTLMLGHCTRITSMTDDELRTLCQRTKNRPVYFVGLPTSDLYMMDRGGERACEDTLSRRRGTLPITILRNDYELNVVLGINNVGNAFTPHGSCDPMHLASMGVGLYQDGTARALKGLFDAVSNAAKSAIGFPCGDGVENAVRAGFPADLVLFGRGMTGEAFDQVREHKTLLDVVNDPLYHRTTIFNGRMVAARP